MNENKFSLIVTVINAGFVDLVMDAAKEAGAGGGTVILGRGTGNEEIEKLFGIVIQPEKEVVLIIALKEIVDDVLKAIYDQAGLKTPGQGIAFAVPLDDAVGIGKATTDVKAAAKIQKKLTTASEKQEE